ncbi:hypothetical protein HPP92_020721 [Vanilla planifolia]|uniref:Uncharacterized protein n=1 Tax=Vanilla planifolia TaxID=51239 RepID=A0A835PZN9_VANPL|nr:hypothetical protein HPP92_020721 [Vanilla planifolia]
MRTPPALSSVLQDEPSHAWDGAGQESTVGYWIYRKVEISLCGDFRDGKEGGGNKRLGNK